MADILITHSYFLHFDPKQWKTQKPYPPLATLYAAAVLKQQGADVAFYDVMFDPDLSGVQEAIRQHRPAWFVICDDGFNYLTKMCLTNMREAAFGMITYAKQQGCRVVISGSDATDHSGDYLHHGADYIVVGEAEQTLKELITSGEDHTQIHGLRYLENNLVQETARRENLRELDTLPFPAWELVNIEAYRSRWLKSAGYFSLNIGTTRGCPFKCNWCAKPIYGNRYNSRSPENVVEELLLLKQAFEVDHIWFCDDIFGLKPGWVNQFAVLVHNHNLDIRFKIQSRVDLLLEEENIAALARAGCEEIWVGAESGSQKILDAMDKGTRVEQIYESVQLMKSNQIKPCFFLQFGYPGESREDIDATLKMVFDLMPHDLGISVSYPLPGTKFYETVKSQLKEKANWTDSDELALLFEGTYPSAFYKKLQRYVHQEFRKRKALEHKKYAEWAYRLPRTFFSKVLIRNYVR
jgi:radical SAM superfamily enzyme YgiQ (UPF0313 family)